LTNNQHFSRARYSWHKEFSYDEVLVIKPDRVLVTLLTKHNLRIVVWEPIHEFTKSLDRRGRKEEETNFAILNSEIIKIEIKKVINAVHLKVLTGKKEYEWYITAILPEKETLAKRRDAARNMAKDCENMLRPVFKDKLSVKKWYQ
jgi:hypothetical protein